MALQNDTLGRRVMETAFTFFLLGGINALLMRLQLMRPENDLVSPQSFNQFFTMHGSTMMFLFAVPMLEGFAILLLPFQLGNREMPFPRLGVFSFWIFLFGGLLFYASFLFNQVPDAGWFAYPPLSENIYSPSLGMDFWLLALGVSEIGAIAFGIEIIIASLNMRAPGMTISRMPIYAWAMLITAFSILFAFTPLGLSVHVNPQARNSHTYDGRPPCCGNATCVPICPIGAKYDGAVHAVKAEQLGAQIFENAVASFVEVGAEGMVTGIRFKRPDGSEERAVGRIYILAGNAMETPKLLLISRSDALPNGVANSSDQVGRNLMDHPIQLSWALAKEPVFPYRSPLENAAIHDFRDGAERSRRSAFLIAIGEEGWSFPGVTPIELTGELLKEGYRGKALREEMNSRVARQFRFANLIEQMPDPENRIVPAFDQVDAIGIPRPRITYRLDEITKQGLAEARRVSDRIFAAMGATFSEHSEFAYGAGHIMGTYRMGTDPNTSVVDPDSRAHDHPNLYLLGSGVFPTVGTANPTLTIAALSLRTAETIRQELQSVSQVETG